MSESYREAWIDGEDGAAQAIAAVLHGKPYNTDGMAPALVEALARVRALRDEREELRLTLAAEQGKPEGAPSEGWVYDRRYRDWCKPGLRTRRIGLRWIWRQERAAGRAMRGEAPSARAAMIAADKATR